MDVPSWHPANQNADALRRLAMSGGGRPKRTEFKDVDTLTEAERAMVVKDESASQGGGRGLLDPSDRLYLVEQTLLEQQAADREQRERYDALQTFRSKALEVHARKTSVPELVVQKPSAPPKVAKPVVVVVPKAKKRTSTTAEMTVKTKMRKKSRSGTRAGPTEKAKAAGGECGFDGAADRKRATANGDVGVPVGPSAVAGLVDGYSSDD
ncbi:unnamed protein product [Hyaloperonospora brassicae]|uniref:FAM192A/Fyv6 N-terminal domain-containing protein n=1 Tax=Hyaloperonospora brassicae TaxID=162125 RepID=A0AAV0U5F1_HYABA|nr:unnamed protein product [Hyaloperonospora brassicae]